MLSGVRVNTCLPWYTGTMARRSPRKSPDYAALGRKGGKASLRIMTPEARQRRARAAALARHRRTTKAERSEAMRRAVLARWRKTKRRRRRDNSPVLSASRRTERGELA
jgi:hypothetical protein